MKRLLPTVLLVAAAAGLAWGLWLWLFCRFYVEPGQMAVITAKTGKPLAPGRILAGPGERGIREEVLGEGRHFLNPVLFEREILPAIDIPPGSVGVVTAKVGADLPAGEFLADRGQKGVWHGTLGPGKYRLNPHGYEIEVIPAISIPIGYVGVITSLSGQQAPEGQFAGAGQKGIRRDILQPGLYYINQREYKVDVLEIGVNQVSLLGKTGGEVIAKSQMATMNDAMGQLERNVLDNQMQKRQDYLETRQKTASPAAQMGLVGADRGRPRSAAEADEQRLKYEQMSSSAILTLNQFVEFPSRDGFEISLDMTVEFELPPENIAWIYQRFGDLPAVVDKIVMPQILSVSRLKGSVYRATDFIVGADREKFQSGLTEALAQVMGDRRVIIHNALIRHVNVPMQILDPIQQASIAVEEDLTNQAKQDTARKQAELNTEQALIEQRSEEVAQQTERLKAQIQAEEQRQVATIHAEALKKVAEIERDTALIQAERARKLGAAAAGVITLVEGERARGFELKTAAFGDPAAFVLWEFADQLAEKLAITILHAGPGTLWTDLRQAGLGELGGAAILQQAAGADAPQKK